MLASVRITEHIGEGELLAVVRGHVGARLIGSATIGLTILCDGYVADPAILTGIETQRAESK
jgi:hypothetical protein